MVYVVMVLMIGLLILIHEFGHLCAAKKAQIPVKQFSIGYGPKLWGFTYNKTEYRISLVPIGGYVMLDVEALEDYFSFSLKKRLFFAFAGPLANIIAAWIGLLLINLIQHGFHPVSVLVLPLMQLWTMTIQFVQLIPSLFSNPKQLSGIVGLVAFGGQAVGADILKLLNLSVILNINLAILNLLPMMPLDGGKIVLDVLHRLQLPVRRLYVPIALAGWLLLLSLMVYVTINDVSKLCA